MQYMIMMFGGLGATLTDRDCYLRAARMTASLPEQRYLTRRAARLHPSA